MTIKSIGLRSILQNTIRLLAPTPPIGGLAVTDSAIQFLEFRGGKEFERSLRLPPGVVEEGKVKDKKQFVDLLKKLHEQIVPDGRKLLQVILTIPGRNAYVQSFTVSRFAETNIAEAADLNMRMISPMNIEDAYYSWQKVGEASVSTNQIELLGAFVHKGVADDVTSALREGGYGVAAVEFSDLSIVRNLAVLGVIETNLPYMIVDVSQEGLSFMVVRGNNLHFSYFYAWSSVRGEERSITLDAVKRALETEVQKILNFYSSRWGGQIKNVIVVTPTLGDELLQVFRGDALAAYFYKLDAQLVGLDKISAVRGAALRGAIPRVDDVFISLSSVGAARAFEQDQILRFISVWRNVLLVTAAFILFTFAATDLYLGKSALRIADVDTIDLHQPETVEFLQLQEQAREFNALVDSVAEARKAGYNTSSLLKKLDELAGARIDFDRLFVQEIAGSSLINGSAPSTDEIIEFKNRLLKQPQFTAVDLPLSSIVERSDGQFAFTVTFTVGSFEF